MKRLLYFAYGVTCYAIFFATFLYLIGFLLNIGVPKTIESEGPFTGPLAWIVNFGLLALFGVQHTVMARPGFKKVWTRVVPEPIERSTYVLLSSLALIALYALWSPVGGTIWNFEGGVGYAVGIGIALLGYGIILLSTFLIDHFDLFGLRQVFLYLRNKPYTSKPFKTPSLYKHVRHPLYVGWITAVWATPFMTGGHLLLAAVLTGYIFIALIFEERDLVDHFGEVYERYRETTPMIVPRVVPSDRLTELNTVVG